MTKEFYDSIRDIDFKHSLAYEMLFGHFLSYADLFPVYSSPLVTGEKIWRSRSNEKGTWLTSKKELSYPPPHAVTSFGRVNKPFQSMFYASDFYMTNLKELMPHWLTNAPIGGIISVTHGQWEIRKPIRVTVSPDYSNSRMEQYIKNIHKIGMEETQCLSIKFINKHFKKLVDCSTNTYLITTAFCNAFKYLQTKANDVDDGILYTSVQDGIGFNLALNPTIVDEGRIELINVWKQDFQKIDHTPTYVEIGEQSVFKCIDKNNGTIFWQ